MPELTHDTEDGFHEIQLSGKQLVFLFMTATVVSVVIFLCGVLVGRNIRAERGDAFDNPVAATPASETPVAAAGPPAAEPPAPPAEDELSYHKRLQSTAPVEEPKPASEQPVAAPQRQPAAPAAVDVPTSGRPGTWFVQVHALQNRDAAVGIVKNLAAKGYPAYLEMPPAGAPVIYRIRIGRYGDRREAEQVAQRLEKEEQFSRTEVRR